MGVLARLYISGVFGLYIFDLTKQKSLFILNFMKAKLMVFTGMAYLFLTKSVGLVSAQGNDPLLQVQPGDLGFRIPNLVQFLSFMIRFFFVLAGLLALFYMLWGALSWVTSGGSEDGVAAARKKIVAAVVGVILIVATLAIIAGLEQIVFQRRVCFGLTCPLYIPSILQEPGAGGPGSAPDEDFDFDGVLNRDDQDVDGDGVCPDNVDLPDKTEPNGRLNRGCTAGPDPENYNNDVPNQTGDGSDPRR